MTDLRYVGVLLTHQEIVLFPMIPQVFICFHKLNLKTESIVRTRDKDR